ncbi:hypothetical protein EDB92DRAFT_1947605 [Lactarius akahatsu]|uniref:T6SS Phospholipase effector Tle1-like catalytic domain-containing protein n=1 Tax=Lactarius akahatsu TaxID=416441 RepID=A0AAD4LCU9_9AGAM|nr:hypothetical protein EDB92DRAFT_1947605 [Lactarius akahatsu]
MTIPSYSSTFPIEDDHRKPRTLVLCFDGTANEFSERNTNVAGIGTYFQPGVVSPLFRFAARTLDEMFAWYLSEHIMDGYKFLMQNYHEGDSVCIFGFSRGAYTARALAGMLHKVGLLSKDNHEQVSFAYKLYKSSSRKNDKLAVRFKKSFSREVPIEFLGVWDTVASVGIVNGQMLPFVGTNSTVKWFRQALSLDERRAKFRPNLYHRTIVDSTPKLSQTRPPARTSITRRAFTFPTGPRLRDTPHDLHDNDQDHRNVSESDGAVQRVLEVWFAGSHSDVGGGLVKDTEEHALSNIPLRWMVREILKTNCHIHFDEAALNQWGIPVAMIKEQAVPERTRETSDSTLYMEPSSRHDQKTSAPTETPGDYATGTDVLGIPDGGDTKRAPPSVEESLDAEDAVEKMGDQLKKNRFWWVLEIIPTYYVWQNEKDAWVGRWSFNRGRGRKVPSHPRPLFHESVRTRMKDPYLDYVPGARYERGIEEYVV